jgi:hypothetical protein
MTLLDRIRAALATIARTDPVTPAERKAHAAMIRRHMEARNVR